LKKQAQHRLPQCLRPKKQTLTLKKQGGSQKHCKFTWKKGTAPSSTMPEAKKTKILIEKTIFNRLEAKKTNTFIEKSIFNRLDTKKNKDFHSKINFNSAETKETKTPIEKSIFNRSETKKTKILLENSIFNKPHTKKQTLSLKKQGAPKTLYIQMEKGYSTVFHNA